MHEEVLYRRLFISTPTDSRRPLSSVTSTGLQIPTGPPAAVAAAAAVGSQLDGMAFSPSQARHPPFHLTQFTNIYDNIETRVS